MKRDNPEQRLQISVAQYLGHALKPPTIWTAFPAGGGGRVRGAFLKAMGLKAGWPDILVVAPGPRVVGLELKAGKGRQSETQIVVGSALRACGAAYCVVRTVDDVENVLRVLDIPLSASVRIS